MDDNNIFSTQLKAGNRTYFLDVKTTQDDKRYLKITESKRVGESEFERYQIMVFDDDIDEFVQKVSEAVGTIRPIPQDKKNEVAEKTLPALQYKKSYSVTEIRKTHRNAYQPWTEDDDHRLELLYCEGKSFADLSQEFGRNRGAIRSRIKKLELKEKYG